MRILVTGASGLIGKNLIRLALREGHEVHALVRHPQSFKMLPMGNISKWTHEVCPPVSALAGMDVVIHLAGENIAGQAWSAERKKELEESRILGTRNLVEALSRLPAGLRPKALISGSAIGFYGYNPTGDLDETSPAGDDFLARLCQSWEQEASRARDFGLRVTLLRTGLVLSREGGALPRMPSIPLGDGRAWMSWIHVEDLCRLIMHVAQDGEVNGPLNAVSPEPVQNREFSKQLARIRKVPSFGFVPRPLLVGLTGEMSQALLSSQRVFPRMAEKIGFRFHFPDLQSALERELSGLHFLDRSFFQDQFVPMQVDEVFPFFSRAENLEMLTPEWLNFKIISKSSDEIKEGTLIEYQLRIHGVPVRWKTRIETWSENKFFIDEQLKGPYRKWRHLHQFESVPGGTLLRDEVTYRIPGWMIGDLVLARWIASDISRIFAFRQNKIEQMMVGQFKNVTNGR